MFTCSFYRCQIAVHQECYGAKHVKDFTSWVCRVCETPDVERECCLCPVKGIISIYLFIFLKKMCYLTFVLSSMIWFSYIQAKKVMIKFNMLSGFLKYY